MIELNRKILGICVVFMLVATLASPLAVATPALDKNNDKFEYFKLEFDGVQGSAEREWSSPPPGMPKVTHSRGVPISSVSIVELTVGSETFDMTTSPYGVDYTETFDGTMFYDNDGDLKGWHMRITDVVTVYEDGTPIGTIILKIPAIVVMGDFGPSIKSGIIIGYGTGELKDVHISAVDLGFSGPPFVFGREGAITGWPAEITTD